MNFRIAVVVAGLLLPACRISVPEGVLPCSSAEDCPVSWTCDRRYCVQAAPADQVHGEVMEKQDAAATPVRDAAVSDAALSPSMREPEDSEDAGHPVCEAGSCECQDGDKKPCYTGPAQTTGRGRCAAGIATCKDGRFGACQDQRLPGQESCANPGVDDDCDGKLDEDPAVGQPCTAADQVGQCARGLMFCQDASPEPVCVASGPVAESCNDLDDDCDGLSDEAFVLTSDAQNCGSCGAACATEQVCCGGQCQSAWPEDYGQQCGGLCDTPGTIQCDGSCDRPDPKDLDEDCGHCGGHIQCDGSCSRPEPPDYGERCNDGVSTVGCSGSCECERQCPSGQIIPCTSLCPILCIGNICIEL